MGAERDLSKSTARAKGHRPYFFDDPAIDKVLAITMAVVGELAVTRERLDTVERLLAAHNIVLPDEIENYRPDDKAGAERGILRQDYIARVLRILQAEADELAEGGSASEYESLQKDLAKPDV